MNRSILPHLFGAALGCALLSLSPFAHAGATCRGETEDGKIVELELNSLGTVGAFKSAELTVKDKAGKVIFQETYDETGQFAATFHEGKAIVVFSTISADSDVFLTFIGKDQDEYEDDKLLAILHDTARKRDTGNRLTVNIYKEGIEQSLHIDDIVVTLHKDV